MRTRQGQRVKDRNAQLGKSPRKPESEPDSRRDSASGRAVRQKRLAAALRENLKRRKAKEPAARRSKS